MANIRQSVATYESWLRKELGRELVEKDLARKHEKMAASPFYFLRGTFWRWAETILEACPAASLPPEEHAVIPMRQREASARVRGRGEKRS